MKPCLTPPWSFFEKVDLLCVQVASGMRSSGSVLFDPVSFLRTTRNWRGGSAMTSSELTLRSAGGGCVLGRWLLP